jgi:CspA family cold shock protein
MVTALGLGPTARKVPSERRQASFFPHGRSDPPPRKDQSKDLKTITGVIKWYDPSKGYGFVTPDDGSPEVLLHATSVQHGGFSAVCEGGKVTVQAFEVPGKGWRAFTVVSMEETDRKKAISSRPST